MHWVVDVSGIWAVTLLVGLVLFAPAALGAKTMVNSLGAGTSGTTGGLFNTARGVAVNKTANGGVPAGTFYVVDGNNNRIQRFSPTGAFVSAWGWGVATNAEKYEVCTNAAACFKGKAGANAGEFGNNGAQGIAVDQANGLVYVSDQVNRRIDVFSSTGVFEGAFGFGVVNGAASFQFCTSICAAAAAAGADAGRFGAAIGGLAVDAASNLYVADKTNRRVDVFTPTLVGSVITGVSFTRGFGWGVDTNAAAFEVCTTASTCNAGATTAPGNNPGQFGTGTTSPSDIAFDAAGNVYALDPANKRVQEFSSVPALITASFGSAALSTAFGTGSLYSLGFDTAADHIYVSGSRSANGNKVAVEELDSAGAHVNTHGTDLTVVTANGLAIAPATLGGNLYLSTATNETLQGVYVLNETKPSIAAPTCGAHTALLNGEVVSNSIAVEYHFEHSTDGVSWTKFPASDVTVPATPGKVPVSQEATGLVGSQFYRFRLVANRPLGGGSATSAEVTCTTTAAAPVISGTGASNLSDVAATLNARVNPQNQPTTWHFEYLSDADFVANGNSFSGPNSPVKAPAADASAGSAGLDVAVSQPIAGLDPATTYHFRLVATNPTSPVGGTPGAGATFTTYPGAQGFEPCPANEAFRTGPGARLPDCRAYEQASPLDKHGTSAIGALNYIEASSAGDRVSFIARAGLPTSGGASSSLSTFIASRGTAAWGFNGVLPLTDPGFGAELLGWSDDLAASASYRRSESGGGIYLGDTASGAYQEAAPVPLPPNAYLAGFSTDTSHLIFESNLELASGGVFGATNLYDLDHGVITLAGRIPTSPAICCDDVGGPACVAAPAGSFAGPYRWNTGDTTSGGASAQYYTQNTISSDGSKVFFTAEDTAGNAAQLYLRDDNTCTTQISASQAAVPDPNGSKPAAFMAAPPDGSKVFFTSCEKLTDDSTAVSTGAATCTTASQGQDLYSYDTASGDLTDLTVDSNLGDAKGAAVQGVLGASPSGADVYFVANGVLAAGASAGDCSNASFSGTCNLYRFHAGTVTFIARLQASGSEDTTDAPNWQPNIASSPERETKESRVAADGTLLFRSQRQLTAYDNQGVAELYRYDATTEQIGCVSCNPTDAAPTGFAALGTSHAVLGAPEIRSTFLTRNFSADGNRIFFDSPDALLSADTNGVLDVYEWEADGSGSCHSSDVGGGCLYLLSSGTSPVPSYFADASTSGDDAFFFTQQPLVPADTDQLDDVYDARVGGGLASQHQPPPSACEGEACRSGFTAPPATPGSSSSSFSGPGNPRPACAKGKHRVNGRCVNKHKHHKKHNNAKRANANRGGAK